MKKFFKVAAAAMGICAFGASAYAASTPIDIHINNVAITKSACDKAGAVEFTFQAGTELVAGDYWYADLLNEAKL